MTDELYAPMAGLTTGTAHQIEAMAATGTDVSGDLSSSAGLSARVSLSEGDRGADPG